MENNSQYELTVSDELILRYFACKTSDEENVFLEKWFAVTATDAQKQRFGFLLDFYESYVLNAPLEMVQGRPRLSEKIARRRTLLRRTALVLGNVAAAVAIFLGTSRFAKQSAIDALADNLTTIAAAPGQRIDLTLGDGTSVRLNSGASISYPNVFADDSRRVTLSGEAYFDVEHDAERPFVVSTFASDIEVLGTEFNVNADESENLFSVSLVEGSVKLTDRLGTGKSMIMKPDQTVSLSGNVLKLDNINISSAISWKDGILNIDTQDFAELMYKLEKTFGVRIVIDRKDMPELKYLNGKLRVSDGVISALNVLQGVADFDFVKDYSTDTIHIR